MENLLWGVSLLNPATIPLVISVLPLSAVLAVSPLVKRAVQVDPVATLQSGQGPGFNQAESTALRQQQETVPLSEDRRLQADFLVHSLPVVLQDHLGS